MQSSTAGDEAPSSRGFISVAPTLTREDVERFGRQMLVEEIGAAHMEQIRHAHVVCVGAGGLGSTVLLYLAGAGVGQLTIVDFDDVELSNLHRQVIHSTETIGQPKALSAKAACQRLVPGVSVTAVVAPLTPANAERLFSTCDVVVDGTDNVAARYLINDAAMRCGKPLVSGSAMGWDGQLSVYGYQSGPCYRCLFPQPPPAETVGSCNETGVVGPLPGMIGCLQALETLKVLTGVGEVLKGRLFLFNGLRFTSRVVKLRARQLNCTACNPDALANSTPLAELGALSRPEYVAGSCTGTLARLPRVVSCSAADYALQIRTAALSSSSSSGGFLTLDVRVPLQFDMAHIAGAVNVPYRDLQQWRQHEVLVSRLTDMLDAALASLCVPDGDTCTKVYVLCRRGIHSAKAVYMIESVLEEASMKHPATERLRRYTFTNVEGGLNAYHRHEKSFPHY